VFNSNFSKQKGGGKRHPSTQVDKEGSEYDAPMGWPEGAERHKPKRAYLSRIIQWSKNGQPPGLRRRKAKTPKEAA